MVGFDRTYIRAAESSQRWGWLLLAPNVGSLRCRNLSGVRGRPDSFAEVAGDDKSEPSRNVRKCSDNKKSAPRFSRRSHVRAIVLDHFVSADTSEHPPSLRGRNASAAGMVARSL